MYGAVHKDALRKIRGEDLRKAAQESSIGASGKCAKRFSTGNGTLQGGMMQLNSRKKKILLTLFLAYVGLILYICFFRPVGYLSDYPFFTHHWSLILHGKDPWLLPDGSMTGNAHPPLYNLLAIPYAIHDNLPRALFALVWLGLGAWLYWKLESENRMSTKRLLFLVAFIFLNPFFMFTIYGYLGQYDILVAALSVASVLACTNKKDRLAGILLGLAVAFKIYPVVIMPALALKGRKVKWQFLYGFFIVIITVFGFSYLLWGNSIFVPISYAMGQKAATYSIFRVLRGVYPPLSTGLNWLSLSLIVASLSILTVYHIKRQFEPLVASILFLMVTLTFYKVGFPQFYTTLFFLIPLWFFTDERLSNDFVLKTVSIMPLVFISVSLAANLIYSKGTTSFSDMFSWVGAPTFILLMLAVIFIFRYALNTSRESAEGPSE
ncbi:MAG: DUF2029 domain-containing protein [Thermoleophilia bacterium]|nr:DUF2029 domain-containing protein [Thermoleophilia bacterium]